MILCNLERDRSGNTPGVAHNRAGVGCSNLREDVSLMIRSYSTMTTVAAIVVLLPLPPLRLDFCFPDKLSFLLEAPLFPLCYSI
jgi:hypothetical protein